MFNRFNLTQIFLLHRLKKKNASFSCKLFSFLIERAYLNDILHPISIFLNTIYKDPPVITTDNNHKSRFKRVNVAAHGCHKSDLDTNADSSEPERRSHQNAKRAQRHAAPVWFLPPPPHKSTTTTWGAAPPSALLAANYSPEGHLVNAHLSFHGLLTSF